MTKKNNVFVVIDVQCGATGPRCADRYPLRVQAIKLVRNPNGAWGEFDEKREVSAFISGPSTIDPKLDFKSFLTPITGISKDDYKHGMKQTLDGLIVRMRKYVPLEAIVVCQGEWTAVQSYLEMIGLVKGVNFSGFLSFGDIFNTDRLPEDDRIPRGYTFNLATLIKNVLGRDLDQTNRARDLADLLKRADALLHVDNDELRQCIRQCWKALQERQERGEKSFATAHPAYEGVCLGHMESTPIGKLCHCGHQMKIKASPATAIAFW